MFAFKRIVGLWVSAGCALVLAGCGGGSSATASGGSGSDSGGGGSTPAKAPIGTTQLVIDPAAQTVQVLGSAGANKPATQGLASPKLVYSGSAISVSQAAIAAVPSATQVQELLSLNLGVNSPYYDPSLGKLRVHFNLVGAPTLFSSALAGTGGTTSTDGPALQAAAGHPYGAWVDTDGSVYFTQAASGAIRKISAGTLSTVSSGYVSPTGITGDANFLYFCDQSANKIYRITKDGLGGIVLAGTGTAGATNGAGSVATFKQPTGIAISGNSLVIADYGNNLIRAVDKGSGVTTTFASGIVGPIGIATGIIGGESVVAATGNTEGKVHVYGTSGGSLTLTDITGATGTSGVAILGNGTIMACNASHDTFFAYQFIEGSNVFTSAGYSAVSLGGGGGSTDGQSPKFNSPELLAVTSGTSVIVADNANSRVRTVAMEAGSLGTNSVIFNNPTGFEPNNTVFYDTMPGNISVGIQCASSQRFTLQMVVDGPSVVPVGPDPSPGQNQNLLSLPLAGGTNFGSDFVGGVGGAVRFSLAYGLSCSKSGLIAINDVDQVCIADHTGRVARITKRITGPYSAGSGPDFDPAENVKWLSINDSGTVIIFSGVTSVFRLARTATSDPFDPNSWFGGRIAGTGSTGYADGTGTVAQFSSPEVTFPPTGNGTILFVADQQNQRIRQIASNGSNLFDSSQYVVTTLAGQATPGHADGSGTGAQFNYPCHPTMGLDGMVYVLDAAGFYIRSIDPTGLVSSIAGNGTSGSVDGSPGQIQVGYALSEDSAGNLIYLQAGSGEVIRKITRLGSVYTLSTISTVPFTATSICADPSSGDMYWTDYVQLGKFSRIAN